MIVKDFFRFPAGFGPEEMIEIFSISTTPLWGGVEWKNNSRGFPRWDSNWKIIGNGSQFCQEKSFVFLSYDK